MSGKVYNNFARATFDMVDEYIEQKHPRCKSELYRAVADFKKDIRDHIATIIDVWIKEVEVDYDE